MTDPPPITQVGTTVLIQGEALPLMYRATLALIARRHRDGGRIAAVGTTGSGSLVTGLSVHRPR